MSDLDFTIVTPSFGFPGWLPLCCASVHDQEGVTLEHLVQDGGSRPTPTWTAKFRSLKVICEPDRGMYDAINKALSKARGQFIGHLNSDEQYLPSTLKVVRDYFATHPENDVLFGDAILVDKDGEPLSYRRVVKPLRNHTLYAHLGALTCSTFFRRSLLDRGLSYPKGWKIVGDAAMILNWIEAKIKMAVLHKPLAIFTFTGANLGASALAEAESVELQRQYGAGLRWQRSWLILHHRFRKLFAGAYHTRGKHIEIYSIASPESRERKRLRAVRFGWPTKLARQPSQLSTM